jgi:hypothetical protein
MTKLFPLLRQWSKEANLTKEQRTVFEKHLECAIAMPLPGSFTYGIGSMRFKGKAKSAQRQLCQMGIIEKLSDRPGVPTTIYRLHFPKSALTEFEGSDKTLEEMIEIFCGPIALLSNFQRTVYKGWIELSSIIPIVKDM